MTRKRSKQPSQSEFRWATCKHVQEIGEGLVLVYPSCRGIMIRFGGKLMTTKLKCDVCHFYGKETMMEKTCKTCWWNDCGLCDRIGRLKEDDDTCDKWRPAGEEDDGK